MTTKEFQAAVLEHKDRVYRYARHIVGDAEDAQDIAQESLVKLWQHVGRVDAGPACKSWLLRTAHNLGIDRLRRRSVRSEVAAAGAALDPSDGRPGPERLAESSQAAGRLVRALAGLSDRERAVVLLREVEGMAYDEIARTLDLNMGTLKATLHRTREKLRRELLRAEVTP